jgi:hypothetical protein
MQMRYNSFLVRSFIIKLNKNTPKLNPVNTKTAIICSKSNTILSKLTKKAAQGRQKIGWIYKTG